MFRIYIALYLCALCAIMTFYIPYTFCPDRNCQPLWGLIFVANIGCACIMGYCMTTKSKYYNKIITRNQSYFLLCLVVVTLSILMSTCVYSMVQDGYATWPPSTETLKHNFSNH